MNMQIFVTAIHVYEFGLFDSMYIICSHFLHLLLSSPEFQKCYAQHTKSLKPNVCLLVCMNM